MCVSSLWTPGATLRVFSSYEIDIPRVCVILLYKIKFLVQFVISIFRSFGFLVMTEKNREQDKNE
jgi:hypothetical protein